MSSCHSISRYARTQRATLPVRFARGCCLLVVLLLTGCSAIYHPYTRTIEHKMEVLSRMPKAEQRSIDLRLLGQTPPAEHLVSDGDILGVYIEGNHAAGSSEMPVRFPDDRNVAPAIGYPTPVRNGGMIRIPHVGVLKVAGMTVWQIEELIRHQLTTGPKATVQADKTEIHVSMMWKRAVNVMVVRQEEVSPMHLIAPSSGTDADRRSGQVVELPAFRNDVLNALLETGGFPKTQAENAVYIFKRHDRQRAGIDAAPMVAQVPFGSQQPFLAPSAIQQAAYNSFVPGGIQQLNYAVNSATLPPLLRGGHTEPMMAPNIQQPACQTCVPDSRHPNAVRIPLTLADGELLPFSQEDVILEDGDIVLVESREDEHFFTSGLLGGGQYALPANQDIDVLDAVLLADTYSRRSQLSSPTRAVGGVSVLNRDVTVGASRVVIERKSADGRVEQFRVNLYKAMKDPDQRVLVEPGDRVSLEYTAVEACMAFFERHLLDPFTSGVPSLLN
jgi:protein involved in polysaccharide export with SLBB domain